MNRELLDVLFIGAITTVLVMAFFIKIPIFLLFLILSVCNTVCYLSKIHGFCHLRVILVVLILTQYNFTQTETNQNFSGIPLDRVGQVDLVVIRDSVCLTRGYWSEGRVISVESGQIESEASLVVGIISKRKMYKGELLTDQKINIRSNIVNHSSLNIQDVEDLYRIRSNFIEFIYNRTQSSLLVALVTGSKVYITYDVLKSFRESGCSHILAMSGFHIGVITFIVFLLLKPVLWGLRLYLVTLFVLLFYLLFIGFSPSLLRSLIMFLITIYFRVKHQSVSIIRVITISFLLSVTLFPKEFYTLSFQLSYLALLGIVILGQEFIQYRCFYSLPYCLSIPLIGSISALLGTAMLSFNCFETLYLSGVICSIIVTPLITLFMCIGLLSIPFGFISPILFRLEYLIYFITSQFAELPVIEKRANISPLITSIIIIIPIILLILKLIRRRDARRFNIEFKL